MSSNKQQTFNRSDIELALIKEFPSLSKSQISLAIDSILESIVDASTISLAISISLATSAKALAKEPEILLLDEPFGHIDSFKKRVLRKQLFDYLKIKNISCVVATHDKEDVLAFADKMLFINNGKSLAYGRPKELFSNPGHSFVAAFFSEYSKIDNVIYYSHDIKIVPKSKLRAVVVKSYYKGSYFLIEAVHCSKTVFLEHPEWVRPDSEINIEFKMKA